jgi:tetratricopeptide (TPR) repeat protein
MTHRDLVGLSVAQFLQKKPDAEANFRWATELKRDYALAYFNLGHCLKQRGERGGAVEAFRTAARRRPYYAPAHAELGDLLLQEGRTAEALEQLRTALALNPADAKTKELLDKQNRSPGERP